MLDRDDVDTDQIMPKQFLKRVERTGFGEFLFYDWAKEPGWDLPRNPILVTGRNFGCGSSREHAPWGAARTTASGRSSPRRSPTSSSRTARRSGCCRSRCPRRDVTALMEAGEARSTWRRQEVRFGDTRSRASRSTRRPSTACSTGSTTSALTLQPGRRDRRLRARARAQRPGHHRSLHERVVTRDWDAETYAPRRDARRSAWAEAVIDRLALSGAETVLDAGCGSGRVDQPARRPPAARPRDRGRRLGVDGRAGAREELGAAGSSVCVADLAAAGARRGEPSTPSSAAPSSTGSPTTTPCSPRLRAR